MSAFPRFYLAPVPDGPPAGVYTTSVWLGRRLLQATSSEGKLYVWIEGRTAGCPSGWYVLEEESLA